MATVADEKNDEKGEDDGGLFDFDEPENEPVKKTASKAPATTRLSGKNLGNRFGTTRHKKILRNNIQGVTKPAIRRLARRAGIKRLSGLVYDETRVVLKSFVERILKDAIAYTEHARRKTVTPHDILNSLSRHGRTLYGFGY